MPNKTQYYKILNNPTPYYFDAHFNIYVRHPQHSDPKNSTPSDSNIEFPEFFKKSQIKKI